MQNDIVGTSTELISDVSFTLPKVCCYFPTLIWALYNTASDLSLECKKAWDQLINVSDQNFPSFFRPTSASWTSAC